MKRKQRLILRPVVVASCAVVCIAGLFLQFYANMNGNLHREVQRNLKEITLQSLQLMERMVKDNLSFLHGMASAIARFEEIDGEQALALLAEQPQYHPLHSMTVIRPDGSAHMPGTAPFSAAEQPYFGRALQGRKALPDRAAPGGRQ
ncbi:MAG: hypothetical protein ACLSAP_03915 [Oscillospiraceae bacterium]